MTKHVGSVDGKRVYTVVLPSDTVIVTKELLEVNGDVVATRDPGELLWEPGSGEASFTLTVTVEDES